MSDIIERFSRDHKNREITKQEGNFSLFVWGSSPIGCYPPYTNKYYRQNFGPIVFLTKENFGAGFFSLEDYRKSTREVFDKYLSIKSEKNLLEISDFHNIQKETSQLYEELEPQKLTKLKTEVLVRKIILNFQIFFRCQAMTLFSEALDETLVKEFFDKLNGDTRDFDNFSKISSLLTFKSFVSRNDEALLEFNSKEVYKIQWILGNYLMTVPLTNALIQIKQNIDEKGGVKKISEDIKQLDEQINHNKKKVAKYRSNLTADIKKLFDFNQLCMYIRDIRKDSILKGITMLSNCLRELFSRLDLEENDIIYAFYPDFIGEIYLKNNYINVLNERKKGFIVYYNENGIKSEYGNGNIFLKELFQIMDKSFSSKGKDIIKGSIGCHGFARSRANIILDKKDFSKFKQGDILITSMTRPEFIPIMKKASAVITDEGGITCHAAIVSRELGIPCIIGTKNATRILKDGDLVEVDADKGIVKIIK